MSKDLNIKINKAKSRILSKARIKECFHFDQEECNGDIKGAHSIQANGRLSLLEEEVNKNKLIYSFIEKEVDDYGYTHLKPIGKSSASIFFGFCDYHDNVLFSEIEDKPFEETSKSIFLHSYRAFAHTHHTKKEQLKHFADELERNPNLLEHYEGTMAGFNDGLLIKNELDKMLKNETFSDLEYYLFEYDGFIPIACSSSWSPTHTPKTNKPINMHVDPEIPYQDLFINVIPDLEGTKVVIACLPQHEKCIEYLDELSQLGDEDFEEILTAILIIGIENTFISPFIYNQLSKQEEATLIKELNYSNIYIPAIHFPDSHPKSELNLFKSEYFKPI